MKAIFKLSCAVMMLSCSSVFAAQMDVKGDPVLLEPYAQVYELPANYNDVNPNYHYVTVEGVNRVCYTEANASLQSFEMKIVNVNVGGKIVQWNCYAAGQGTSNTPKTSNE